MQRAPPLGTGRALTLPCRWDIAGLHPCSTFHDCPPPPSGVTARPTCTSSYCVLACGELVGGDCANAASCFDLGGVGVGVCLFPNAAAADREPPVALAPPPLGPSGGWWVQSSLARVMPNSTGPPNETVGSTTVSLALAANERESFQLALRPKTNRSYSIAIPAAQKGLSLSWETVGLVWVRAIETIGGEPHARSRGKPEDGGAGWWPDPTFATPRAFGIAGTTTSVWFTA